MPRGPLVHEIFSKEAKTGQTAFQYDKKETMEKTFLSSKKTNMAPLPPMKKLGGYKPKILGGETDFVPVQHNDKDRPEPPEEQKHRPAPVLTKPKPFVIGDKNIPMVLSSTRDDESVDANNRIDSGIEDMHIYEEPEYRHYSVSDDINNNDFANVNSPNGVYYNKYDQNKLTSGNHTAPGAPFGIINNNNNSDRSGAFHAHHLQTDNDAFSVHDDKNNLVNGEITAPNEPITFAAENPGFQTPEVEENEDREEPEGVFIPEPDYEEDERTMDFADEDPDELMEQQRVEQQRLRKQQPRQHQAGLSLKEYEGEDLSKYLSDDEEDDDVQFVESVKARPPPQRLLQKHSMFKTNPHHTTGKQRKYASKSKTQKFNSLRNFSLADSKFGSSGKAEGKKMTEPSTGEYEKFLTSSQRGADYETFLRSKHGVALDEEQGGGNRMMYAGFSGKQGNGIWKKLTVRLKHKLQRNDYNMTHF